MSDFKRARSDEQKLERMEEVKEVTAQLFATHPYHEVTLSTIGEQLGWSRANLYKYVASKEEVFLALAADARNAYYADLLKAFSKDKGFTKEDVAKKWASIADKNRDWAKLGAILVSIVEENVSLERLKEFKKDYYDELADLCEKVAPNIHVPASDFPNFFVTIHYHACGLSGVCEQNPLVQQAIKEIGVRKRSVNFKKDMNAFILMCLNEYSEK